MTALSGYEVREVALTQSYHVHAVKGLLIVASAEASDLEEYWDVCRVVVLEHRAPRGKGIGSALLKRLLDGIVRTDRERGRAHTRVVVAPGGYGVSPRRQQRFYLHNGFKRVPKGNGLLEWRS